MRLTTSDKIRSPADGRWSALMNDSFCNRQLRQPFARNVVSAMRCLMPFPACSNALYYTSMNRLWVKSYNGRRRLHMDKSKTTQQKSLCAEVKPQVGLLLIRSSWHTTGDSSIKYEQRTLKQIVHPTSCTLQFKRIVATRYREVM
jgi:hypothetical protein